MALEEGNPPFLLGPATLEPEGYETYGGKVKGPFTAHPKVDPETGEMIFFGYSAKEPSAIRDLHVADKDSRITRTEMLEIPFASMIRSRDEELDHRARLPAHRIAGAREKRAAALPEAGKGGKNRLRAARRHGGRRAVGDAATCTSFMP